VDRDAYGSDGRLQSSSLRIGVEQCQCDCGEVRRTPRIAVCDDLDDAEVGWIFAKNAEKAVKSAVID